ncbi:MAG TPA: hypothetical protein VG994_03395 [Steroidobacteraceae bacterium]|nr:hypothetical protein [Steroidobacteraceae bacterium]
MLTMRPWAAVSMMLFLGTMPIAAMAANDEVAELRAELEALKSDYASKVASLEARIAQLESSSAHVSEPASATPQAVAGAAGGFDQSPPPATPDFPPSAAAGAGNGQTAFNPAISVILAGNYAHLSADPETYRIAGFIPSGDEIGPGARSFSLGESELTMAANVDPYFFANVTAAISSDNEIGIEEAYFRTLALREGFTVKGGRFFSGLGYLNEIHAHAWDFVDQPLVYQAFFGNQLAQDGLQAKWLAPTDTFLELGVEAGNGGAFPGTHRNRNGLNATTLFAHVGGDIGDSTSWRTGVSWLDDKADTRAYDDTDAFGAPVVNAFSGTSRTWGLDAIMKWAPHGDAVNRQLKLQGEYFHRVEDGQLAFDTTGADVIGDYRSAQSGWYVQSAYLFRPRWRVGLRYDSMDSGNPRIGSVSAGLLTRDAFPALLPHSPDRVTMMVDWSPSEFSRLRAQYAWDGARLDQRDRQFLIQYLYGIGAHGAHKF